ncbi:MAG: hypothetical protein U0165_20545 [Polyangiaceae bacterium]
MCELPVFLWGQKEERTPTWYGLFAEQRPELGLNGEAYASVDVLQHAWTGNWPSQRAPIVTTLLLDGKNPADNVTLGAGQQVSVNASASDENGDTLTYVWEVLVEASQLGNGGSSEPRPDTVPNTVSGSGAQVMLTAPSPGQYRVYVYALDGHGGIASANFPFRVQ